MNHIHYLINWANRAEHTCPSSISHTTDNTSSPMCVHIQGFPSSGVEGMYRNPLPEVQRFFKKRHDKHSKVLLW